mgnify:FL=1
MKRVLLLIPTTSYRTQAFLDAAQRLGVEITIASERRNVLEETNPTGLLTLNFRFPEESARAVIEFSKHQAISAVLGVDDQSVLAAVHVAEALSLPHNSVASVSAARNKYLMRELLSKADVSQPRYALFSLDDGPTPVARQVSYPCVLKPLTLAGSRGVIRASDEDEFVKAFRRIELILRLPDVASMCRGDEARYVLVEQYVPGDEVALEALLSKGELRVLTIFDKPNPLVGPFFEETIYLTPSRLPQHVQNEIASCAGRATRALGLEEGPVHAELRINDEGSWVIEIAARSIGGFCSRALRFVEDRGLGNNISLEGLILRHALGMETGVYEREPLASGVMMIPIPRGGVLNEVRGVQEAKAIPHIEDIVISAHLGENLGPLPEGGKYLGFIFSRGESPLQVDAALREAHRRLVFVITPGERARSNVEE